MPQLTNLVLTDRKATPVAHTFVPRGRDGNVGTLAESTGVPIGDPRVTVSYGGPTATGRCKPVLRFTFPVMQTQTINGVSSPVVVRTSYAELSFNFDGTTSEAERNDIVGMIQSSLDSAKTVINNTVVKLESIY